MSDTLTQRLAALKRERNAVILAHYYQPGEVQDAADYVGDSLGLSQQAAKTEADVILFCGVHFMAETAAILCPDKVVLIPDQHAGCPMANMITGRQLRNFKAQHPGAVVVCYVNSSADVKAESDICCTSSNAVKVIASVPPDQDVIFVPDQSLGDYAARMTGRTVHLWQGFCPTHHRILPDDIRRMKAERPGAKVFVHPEAVREALDLADYVGSTAGIIKACGEMDCTECVIGTELGILHELRKRYPEKTFYPVSPLADCPNMKLGSLEKMVWALEDMAYRVIVPEEIRVRALGCIERMLAIS